MPVKVIAGLRTKLLLAGGTGLTLVMIALPDRNSAESPGASTAQPEADSATPVVASTTTIEVGVLEAAGAGRLEAQRARSEELTWERDPFARPAPDAPPVLPPQPAEVVGVENPVIEQEPPAPAARPRLTGVSRSEDERWAIVDGQIVREGDTLFSGHEVVRIGRRSVTLVLEGEELNLKLGEQR